MCLCVSVHACMRVCLTCPSVTLTCLRGLFMRISSIDDSQNTWRVHVARCAVAAPPGRAAERHKNTWHSRPFRPRPAAAQQGAAPGRYARCITTCARCTVRCGAHLRGLVAVLEERVRAVAQQPLGPAAAARESPERCVAPQPRPQRAARRAWHGAMRVLSSVRQPKRQRGPKGQSVAPVDCAGPTAKRKGKAECTVPERPPNTRTWRFVRAYESNEDRAARPESPGLARDSRRPSSGGRSNIKAEAKRPSYHPLGCRRWPLSVLTVLAGSSRAIPPLSPSSCSMRAPARYTCRRDRSAQHVEAPIPRPQRRGCHSRCTGEDEVQNHCAGLHRDRPWRRRPHPRTRCRLRCNSSIRCRRRRR